jgi:hypothetical protein
VKFGATEEERNKAMEEENKMNSESQGMSGLKILSRAMSVSRIAMQKKWYSPGIKNDYNHYVRVVATSEDDATIYVNFLLPKDPEIMVINDTEYPLIMRQNSGNENVVVPPNQRVPYAYENQAAASKKVRLEMNGHSKEYNLDKIKPVNRPFGPFSVSLTVSQKGITKELKVTDTTRVNEQRLSLIKILSKKIEAAASVIDTTVSLPGISISIVDEEPKERLLITIFEIIAKLNYETKPEEDFLETITGLELKITHM